MNNIDPGGRYGLRGGNPCPFLIMGFSTADDSYLYYTQTDGYVGCIISSMEK